nr:F-box/kelch-repeat protein At3g61590-like [Aegilops tauschii subsp. strangulata]
MARLGTAARVAWGRRRGGRGPGTPRASAVCKRWRRLVSDRGFLRRYRRHHRRSPPLLGFFRDELPDLTYTPTMEAPDRIPAGRFSLHLYDSRARILSCRHGLLLVARSSRTKFLVWNPVTRDQHRLVAPPAFDTYAAQVDGAVLRAAGDAHHFQVVLVSYQQKQVVACIYSSETGVWSDLMSTPVQSAAVDWEGMPAVLVGDSLHWLLSCGGADVILQVNLSRRSLALIQLCEQRVAGWVYCSARKASPPNYGRGMLVVMVLLRGCWEEPLNWTSYFP